MDDYIRREDASNWLKQYGQDVLHGKYKFSLMYIWKNLMDLPSADVVPVEYGEWIGVPEIWGSFDSRYYCSKCGNDAIINSHERYVLSDFCPHCGAIMDNKRGNESG